MSRSNLPPHIEARLREEAAYERDLLETIEEGLPVDPWGATSAAAANMVAGAVPEMLHRLWRAGEISGERLQDAVAWTWIHNESPQEGLGERR